MYVMPMTLAKIYVQACGMLLLPPTCTVCPGFLLLAMATMACIYTGLTAASTYTNLKLLTLHMYMALDFSPTTYLSTAHHPWRLHTGRCSFRDKPRHGGAAKYRSISVRVTSLQHCCEHDSTLNKPAQA